MHDSHVHHNRIERMISVFTPMWLAFWTEYKYGLSDTEYMSTYAAIGVISALLSWWRTFAWLVASLRAATTLHLKLFHSVLNTRQAFFDTTPLGRIIQRFAKDTNVLDNLLGQSVSSLTSFGLWLLGTMIAMVIIIPILGPFLVPVFACYFYVQYFFRPGYREAKRLDGTSGSPIFEHFGETISGISTIRAFGHQARFIHENEKRIAYNQARRLHAKVRVRSMATSSFGNYRYFYFHHRRWFRRLPTQNHQQRLDWRDVIVRHRHYWRVVLVDSLIL